MPVVHLHAPVTMLGLGWEVEAGYLCGYSPVCPRRG